MRQLMYRLVISKSRMFEIIIIPLLVFIWPNRKEKQLQIHL